MTTNVPNSWLVDVNVSLNVAVTQTPDFGSCMLISVMPTQSSPYQCPPSTWSGAIYHEYTNLADFNTDFSTLLAAAEFAGDLLQANRFQWAINAATAFFGQSPTPSHLYVGAIAPQTSATNYSTYFTTLTDATNDFYGVTIADYLPADAYSELTAVLAVTGTKTIPAGTALTFTSITPTAPYVTKQAYTFGTGTYNVPFYSSDITTAVGSGAVSGISPAISGVAASNTASAVLGIPGIMTPTKGLSVAMTSLRSASNQKKLFVDTNDYNIAATVQSEAGNKDIYIFYHSLNLPAFNAAASASASFSAACLSEYFTDIFSSGIGLKVLSSMQLAGVVTDPAVTGSNIGTPGQAGSSSNLIGYNNNVYPAFGGGTGIGLVQWGYASSSVADDQIYLDQVVGADYLQFVAQADLVTLILNSQPTGGIPYSDVGIQQILTTFKNSVQKAVNQNILQAPLNSAYVYSTYSQVSQQDIANRIYKDLTFNGKFLSRIQQIVVNVNLGL